MTTSAFLAEFPPISTEQWEHLIREKITGTEYASKLIWHPEEALALKPYYRSDDLAGSSFVDSAPGSFPFVRGTHAHGDWRIRESIDLVEPEEANRAALAARDAGAEEIAFCRLRLASPGDVIVLLSKLHDVPIVFESASPAVIRLLIERMSRHPHGAIITAGLDPLADLDASAELIRDLPTGVRPFSICAEDFQERGAGAVEEVAFALSAALDFVAEMRERRIPVDRTTATLSFSFAIGPEFFVQIAKLRAFRLVWAKAVESFGGAADAARPLILARTAVWNTTLYDPESNILRSTSEAMSAVLGGANSILVVPFDSSFRVPDENSRRLARNTQIILKKEASFSRVADPLGGSYLTEALTHSIASKAWKLFQELETAGGYRKASADGVIASVLNRRMDSRAEAVAQRRRVLTGTNRFADPSDPLQPRADVTCNVAVMRAAQPFETLRIRTERFTHDNAAHPRILLAQIGDARMANARAQFAADFLACAGLFATQETFQLADRIALCEAQLIVLCSSDDEYLPVASRLMPLLKLRNNSAKIVVAGNPGTTEQLIDLGVGEFLHLRSNAIEVLGKIQRMIGIRE